MWFLLLKVTSSHFNPKPKLYKRTVLAQVFPHLLSLVRILGHPYTHANIHACTAYKHMHPHTQIHTLLPLLHLKELIVAAHLPGLHHDCGNIMESHVGFWLNPHPACSCISLRVMVTCSPASTRPTRGIVFTWYVCQHMYSTPSTSRNEQLNKGEVTILANVWGCRGQRSSLCLRAPSDIFGLQLFDNNKHQY